MSSLNAGGKQEVLIPTVALAQLTYNNTRICSQEFA